MQVEQVLETYFMNLDNTYNKLQTLGEYVDDTEDYVRFEIDTQRNRFIEVRARLIIVQTCSHQCNHMTALGHAATDACANTVTGWVWCAHPLQVLYVHDLRFVMDCLELCSVPCHRQHRCRDVNGLAPFTSWHLQRSLH